MLIALLLAAAPDDCIALVAQTESALVVRARDEVAAAVGRPVSSAAEAVCSTTLTIDEHARQVRVVSTQVSPSIVFEEPLTSGPVPTVATHLAEVVRGVLLEVEERLRQPPPVEVPQEAPAIAVTAPKREAPRPVVELSAGSGVLVAPPGLSPSLVVEVSVAWRFTARLGVVVSVVGGATAASARLPEGEVSARPFASWAMLSLRLEPHERWRVLVAVGGGGFWVPLEGRAVAPFVGARADGFSGAFGGEARLQLQPLQQLGVFAAVAPFFLTNRLALVVAGTPVASFGAVVGLFHGGVELTW